MIEKQSSVSTTRTPHVDRTPQVDKSKWVINLSSRSLSNAEVSLLQKGLNFAVTPTSIPATETVAKVESAIRPLDAEQADTVRRNVNSILQRAKPPEPNITREMKQALKGSTEDKNIMILPADKGRASVVLDKNTYDDKLKTLIEKGPFRLYNKDPTDRLSRKLTEKLLNLKRGGHLTESVCNKIRPKHKQPPRIYGLPKIHKVNTPLRPIVSCVNTFAYDLSSYLADVLSPLTGKSEYTVNNSAHFVSTINGERVLESEIMVSFDVESLFTNVPIEGAVQAALRKLEADPCLANRTTLTPAQIADLLDFVLRSTYFQYDGLIYEQQEGAVISQEKKHLSSVLVSNGYPFSFVKNITKTKKQTATKEPAPEIKSTAVLPYVKGLSEAFRRCLQQQGIRTVFRSDTTLRSHLARPKDTVDPAKQDGVVYKIPCECGKVYIGETGRSMHERIKEHDRDMRLARTQSSAVSEHSNATGHYPLWDEVKFIDRDPHWYTRRVKEAIHIRLHPDNINKDNGIEIPEAWMPTIKQHSSRSVPRRTAEGTISSLNDEDRNPPINNSLREDRNAPINTNQGATYTVTQPVDTIA